MSEEFVVIGDFLNLLEEKETKLLTWGFVDGGFSKEELLDIAEEFLSKCNSELDPEGLLGKMEEDYRVLFSLNYGSHYLYRTRMAETVRLMARLRQIFHYNKDNWRLAPTLVADFRFSLQPRTYPQRYKNPDVVLCELQNSLDLSSTQKKVLQLMLNAQTLNPFLLSDFQIEATKQLLEDIRKKYSTGMIVCAGTGTGKTLAFYIPALLDVANLIDRNNWTKAIAIYPRNELLKDQFTETFNEVRKLDDLLSSTVGRKIIIGAFFGSTPYNCDEQSLRNNKWKLQGNGYVCPFLKCPKCQGDMVWNREDLHKRCERLKCLSNQCNYVIYEDTIVLTRSRMVNTAPDILFTTTEMLNRNMSDSRYRHLFGIESQNEPPRIMLLDEVHTYTGVHGAQVANLLRRWQALMGSKVHFVGLSATLNNAKSFLAQLTGLNENKVNEIKPANNQMVQEGKEYSLALRGDPVSATSLLSTTIQAAMLMRRVLETTALPKQTSRFYGERVFLFTDDLDVTNRLYYNLMDAEGLNGWGNQTKQPLSAIRSSKQPENRERLLEGQSWLVCEEIGHPMGLSKSLKIDRTSSQDSGVEGNADIVVSTASLEVGFNDPKVGAVIQHKAPYNMASFLQRKGRAGRNRKMRPWMVTVLSDYGRDRLAYQGYDRLFSPILEKRTLPVSNHYILRMQAVYAFMDWVALEMPTSLPKGSIWGDFSGLANWDGGVQRQEWLGNYIQNLYENEKYLTKMRDFIKDALKISDAEVISLLWEPPRAIMTEVLPTLLRRLKKDWKISQDTSIQNVNQGNRNPLPEFIPSNLFSDLNLPEVIIRTNRKENNEETMGIVQALRTFAPGRVSRRFGVDDHRQCHWVAPLDFDATRQNLPFNQFCNSYENLGVIEYNNGFDHVNEIPFYRPNEITPKQPPKSVGITSNAQLNWVTQIIQRGEGVEGELPYGLLWNDFLEKPKFFTHNHNFCVVVKRAAVGAKANLKFTGGREKDTEINFVDEFQKPVGVGFVQETDAILFKYRIPAGFKVNCNDFNQEKVRSFRTAYFKHRIMNEQRLNDIANVFQRDWIYQIYLSTLVFEALTKQLTLAEAYVDLHKGNLYEKVIPIMETIFQIPVNGEENENDPENYQKVHQMLLDRFNMPEVCDLLKELAPVMFTEPDNQWDEWSRERFQVTLGSALLHTCLQLSSQFEVGDLLLDITQASAASDDKSEQCGEIWISEAISGGGGAVEEIFRKYVEDPRRFFRLAENTLYAGDYELVDSELTRVLELSITDSSVRNAMDAVRSARDFNSFQQAVNDFKFGLAEKGIITTHPVMTSINIRILRPNSSEQTDRFLHQVVSLWKNEESRLGIEIDARVFAYVVSGYPELESQITTALGFGMTPRIRSQAIYGLLWPRGNTVRSRDLAVYNPFSPMTEIDRELLLDVIKKETVVSLTDQDWEEQVKTYLSEQGFVTLYAPLKHEKELKKAILKMIVEPVGIGFLNLYPRLEAFVRRTDGNYVKFDIRETVQ